MTVLAIETRYAGCRFRSRLEARWAVFFDTLGIRWQYEPQGFVIADRHGGSRDYLPDFYLPEQDVWVEVKGSDEAIDWTLLGVACDGFSRSHLPNSRMADGGYDAGSAVLVLGDIPAGDRGHWHPLLINRESVRAYYASFGDGGSLDVRTRVVRLSRPLPSGIEARVFYEEVEVGMFDVTWSGFGADFDWREPVSVHGMPFGFGLARNRAVLDAYRAARSARFEHGERP